jgi:hypothetical protein
MSIALLSAGSSDLELLHSHTGHGGVDGVPSLVFSAMFRWNAMPTPSMTARRIAHPMALLRMIFAPPRTEIAPPVMKPLMMAFHESCFFLSTRQDSVFWVCYKSGVQLYLMPCTAQAKVEKTPPHTPKFPPRTGARALMAVTAPIRRSPYGELLWVGQIRNLLAGWRRSCRNPLIPCHTAPPIAYRWLASHI